MSKFLKSNYIDLDEFNDRSDYADFKSNINRNEGKINPFAGTDYEDMWINNPYATLYYKPTWLDNIGFSNKAKDANSEYERLYNEYIAGIYDLQRSDEYNSPSAEAQRLKEAGINPDLQGLSGHSNTGDMNKPDAGHNPALNGVSPFSHLTSFVSMVSNAAIGAQSMISQSIVNDGMRLQNLSNVYDIGLEGLSRSGISYDPEKEIMPAFTLGYNTGSKRLDKKLEKASKNFLGTIPAKIALKKNEKELAQVRKEAFDITSSAGYSEDDDFYSGLASLLAEAQLELLQLDISNKEKELGNTSEYLDTIDSKTEAKSKNESNKRSLNKDSQWNKFIELERGIIKYIKNAASNGDTSAIELLFRLFGEQTTSGGGTLLNWSAGMASRGIGF